MKILIVDDNSKMREMIRNFLQDLFEEIRECDDGIKALAFYANFHPDWVLMDWEMKEMDGLTATRQIIERFPEANILIVTQFDDVELRTAASDAGASGYVLKDDLQSLRHFIGRETL
jgi:two-component system response regulator DegU